MMSSCAAARARAASKSSMRCRRTSSVKIAWTAFEPNSGSSKFMSFASAILAIEEDSFFGTLQNDVPIQPARVAGRGFRYEGGPARRIDERKHGIVRVAGSVRKINSGHQAFEQSPHKHRDFKMWRLQASPQP